MKVVVQRVKNALVRVDGKLINKIAQGYLLYVGFTSDDDITIVEKMVKKIVNLRIFADNEDKMNKSILDIKGSILSISQFTLYADVKKGNRPSFVDAMDKDEALELYNVFNNKLNELVPTYSGVYGANMQIESINDGPITILIDI